MIAIFGALKLYGLWGLASQRSGIDGSAYGGLDRAL
jgi:hypothetical protein